MDKALRKAQISVAQFYRLRIASEILRKHIGFGHIGEQHAEAMDNLNPRLNFHRPCAVPLIITEANREAPPD